MLLQTCIPTCIPQTAGEKKPLKIKGLVLNLAEEVRFEERAQITQVIDSKGLARPVKPYGTFLAQSTQDIGTKKQA